ncbi:MAG: GTP-binding protein [Chloroflexi bacterium]|nr:GTP-binding protein [Chloroflexota bacterium]
MAADSAVMVLDAAKGVEAQTRKLFDVCRQRGIPMFTFINKMDRPSQDALELMDEVENVLGMQPAPLNWPVGDGDSFMGVYDRQTKKVYLYDRTVRNQTISPETITTLDDPRIAAGLNQYQLDDLHTNIALLDELGLDFDFEAFRRGEQTPFTLAAPSPTLAYSFFSMTSSAMRRCPPPTSPMLDLSIRLKTNSLASSSKSRRI